ncbi:hypothetical protein H0H93_008988, partial [Arthromyces matolae]
PLHDTVYRKGKEWRGYRDFCKNVGSCCRRETGRAFVKFKTKGTGLLAGTPVAYTMLKLKVFDKDGKIAALADKLVLPDTPTYRLEKEWLKNDLIPFIEMTGYDRFMPGLATPEPGAQYLSTSIITLHPFNVGSVHITSNDPNTAPAIDPNYLDNEFDIQVLIEAFRFTRTMFGTSPLKDLIEEEVFVGIPSGQRAFCLGKTLADLIKVNL